jgi:hypothetical protein
MTTKQRFLRLMAERRQYPRNSLDWMWRTRAARKLVWLMMGRPVKEWTE